MTYTVVTLECGARALRSIAQTPAAGDRRWLERELRRGGCAAGQIEAVVQLLTEAGLLETSGAATAPALTPEGYRVIGELQAGSWRAYATALLNLVWVEGQLSKSLRYIDRSELGPVADLRALSASAPQLGVILSWMRSVGTDMATVVLPESVLKRIHLVEGEQKTPEWVVAREAIGFRAERYSLHYERTRKAPAAILHVSAGSDRYGYDIEDRSSQSVQAIEVKGSAGADTVFYLTEHERAVAARMADNYIIHFWGEVDLRRSMSLEYDCLRTRGYPREYLDPSWLIAKGDLALTPTTWRVVGGPKSESGGDRAMTNRPTPIH